MMPGPTRVEFTLTTPLPMLAMVRVLPVMEATTPTAPPTVVVPPPLLVARTLAATMGVDATFCVVGAATV